MKFSKRQKDTVRLIQSGDIYDISTYLKYFKLGREIKFSKEKITEQFHADCLPKTYYRRKDLQPSRGNTLSEIEYNEKLHQNQIDPNKYISENLQLSYSSGIKQEFWENNSYTINFYDGVYIPNDFQDVLDFLTLWQYLKSEMLILEVPNSCSAETLSLFYEPSSDNTHQPHCLEDQLKCIDYSTLTYADTYYIGNENYAFSHEHCSMCKDYLGKKIYPSTKLSLFIKKKFKTYEETTQNRALFVAWLAIFVSIILTFAPYLHQEDNPNLTSLVNDVNEIKNTINAKDSSTELTSSLDAVLEKLDLIIEHLSKESEKNPPEEKK